MAAPAKKSLQHCSAIKIKNRVVRLTDHHLGTTGMTFQVSSRRTLLLNWLEYRKLTLEEAVCTKLHALLRKMRFEVSPGPNPDHPSRARFLLRYVVLFFNIKIFVIGNRLLQRSVLLNQRRLTYVRFHKFPLQLLKPLRPFATIFDELPKAVGIAKKVTNVRRHKR